MKYNICGWIFSYWEYDHLLWEKAFSLRVAFWGQIITFWQWMIMFDVNCHFWFKAWVTHTLGPWFNQLFPLGNAKILKASLLKNVSIQYLSGDMKKDKHNLFTHPNFFHICAEKSSDANVRSRHRIKQRIKYIFHITPALCSTTLWFFPFKCISIWVWEGAPTLSDISD